MMRALKTIVIIFLALVPISCSSARRIAETKIDVSPYDFGLRTAKTGVERYQVLLKTHQAAVAAGVNVDYSRIDTIRIEIPDKPKRIPLTQYNDFKGCVIVVKNTAKNCWLFGVEQEGTSIEVSKQAIDAGDFRAVEPLKHGRYLLIIEDEKPWVLNRKGHDYGHQRKDILLVENGVAKNSVIKSYNNDYSSPKCSFIKVDESPLVLKNLTIERDGGCTNVTHVANISGYNDVRVSNIKLHTPVNALIDDRGIRINNCTNVTLEDVRIDGTYSQSNHSGYGVNMNNIWNFKAVRMYGKANWGIFGNNNINTARIENSKINRFDIHCYGRDISFENVEFFDLYNQYSSTFGTICYKNCTFTNFTPVLNGGSYNAYVEHEVVFNDCVFNATSKKWFLIRVGKLNDAPNQRSELAEKCLPNVRIKNLVVNMTEGATDFYVFYGKIADRPESPIGHLSQISIEGLTINPSGEKPVKRMMLSNIEIGTKVPVDCQIKNVTVNNPQTKSLLGSSRQYVQLKSNLTVKGGKIQLRNATGIVQ